MKGAAEGWEVSFEPVLSFGRWRLMPSSRRLWADDVLVTLGSRAFDLLLALVDRRGELVTKDELLRRVWPDAIVEENNLQVQVSTLRKAFGEDARWLITTSPGRGYRFTDIVRVCDPAAVERVGPHSTALIPSAQVQGTTPLPPSLHDRRPVLVVLPFTNMTGGAEQEYFADGITEDLTTALAHLRWFSVIARNSAFAYKGRAVDVRQVGRELGVGYVLEGSVRRAGGRVRITAQLCETEAAGHVWAERFDGDLADIFDLQDRVVEAVAGAVEPSLRLAEAERVRTKPTESLGAYDLYLRALPHRFAARESSDDSLRLLRRAVALDPDFEAAKGALAELAVIRASQGWAEEGEGEEAVHLAREIAQAGGREDPSTLAAAGYALSYLGRDYAAGLAAGERAVLRAPNSASVLFLSGWTRIYAEEWQGAILQIGKAMRLSPIDPSTCYFFTALSGAHFVGQAYEEASTWARRAIRERPSLLSGHRLLTASLARLGRAEAAREALRALLAVAPGDRIATVAAQSAVRGKVRDHYLDGLRRAGLPE